MLQTQKHGCYCVPFQGDPKRVTKTIEMLSQLPSDSKDLDVSNYNKESDFEIKKENRLYESDNNHFHSHDSNKQELRKQTKGGN